jgi:hypothetical protein
MEAVPNVFNCNNQLRLDFSCLFGGGDGGQFCLATRIVFSSVARALFNLSVVTINFVGKRMHGRHTYNEGGG